MHKNSTLQALLGAIAIGAALVAGGCDTGPQTAPLINGKDIVDADATPLTHAQLPLNLALAAGGKYAVICGMGYRQALWAVRTADDKVVSRVDFVSHATLRANPEGDFNPASHDPGKTIGLYYGLAAAPDGAIYAAQGAHDSIARLTLSDDGQLTQKDPITTRPGDFPAGLALDQRGYLYVTNNCSGESLNTFGGPASLAIYDTRQSKEVGRFNFTSPLQTSNFPLGVLARADGSVTYVASERDGVVYTLDTHDPTHIHQLAMTATGSHPVAMVFDRAQSRLFVANALSDTISVIDTASNKVVGTVLLRPDAARDLPGASPTSLALSPDEKTLYVTLADMNALAVVDVAALSVRGMMPVGWYPSAVAVVGDRLLVVNARGHNIRLPNPQYDPYRTPINRDHFVLVKVQGDLQSLPIPSETQLREQTADVLSDNHIDRLAAAAANPLGDLGIKSGKIKHVIYIVKENRTYDQVLGDDPRGNGDAALAIFGRNITPNLHALADRFVLLDNAYACGDVSGDGWVWSTQGMANVYVERNIPYYYSARGRAYDFEGENNEYPTGGLSGADANGRPMALGKAGASVPPVPDIGATGVHLWDRAREAGLSYRNYGFFLTNGKKASAATVPDNVPDVKGVQPPGHDLAGITDVDFRRFDLDYADSQAPKIWFERTHDRACLYHLSTYGKHDAPSRFDEWNDEFAEMLKTDPSGNAVPALITIRMPHDHTQGMRSRSHTPQSEVADNDYGIGQIVDAVSHSPIWSSTAIFVIEDDAQTGPDHVDCHRTTCYAISPWIKRGTVDSTFQNTDSVLHTMELLLNLPPMTQYDAEATPILDWDDAPRNAEPFDAILPAKDLIAATNAGRGAARGPEASAAPLPMDSPQLGQLQAASDAMDFDHADAAPADLLNQIIWKSVHGPGAVMPAPRHSLISPLAPRRADKDDDDD
jgi:YVTN family beta-propeller protein